MINPFRVVSDLNLSLDTELCQSIHYGALRQSQGKGPFSGQPQHLSITTRDDRHDRLSQGALLLHPAVIEEMFCGVTLEVYKAIEQLYCSRLQLSFQRIHQLLAQMSRQAGVSEITSEAVWAMCTYLDEKRIASQDVTLEITNEAWRIIRIWPNALIGDQSEHPACITCVISGDDSRALAFRVGTTSSAANDLALSVYDAVVALRQPSPDGAAGLKWRTPNSVLVHTDWEIPASFLQTCNELGLKVNRSVDTCTLENRLRDNWLRDVHLRQFQVSELTAIFDHYLYKVHGYGPLHTKRLRDRKLRHVIGYNRDPAWQFPTLRQLLPVSSAQIDLSGTIAFDGLHYDHEFLSLWPGQEVTLRRSEYSDAIIYAYIDGEILCQAMARELRRRDGSYRSRRK